MKSTIHFRMLLPATLLMSACIARHAPQPGREHLPPPTAMRHWVYDRELRDLMVKLQRETTQHWPQELNDEHTAALSPRREMAFEQVGPLADALAQAADGIPEIVAHLDLSEADRRAFVVQAVTLGDQARRLTLAGREKDESKMRSVLEDISATCRACHVRFLDLTGPLHGTGAAAR